MMRKYLVLIIGMLFVFGFTATAFAIHAENPEVAYQATTVVAKGSTVMSLGGELRERGRYYKNTGLDSAKTDDKVYYDSRIRLNVDAKLKNVEGFLQIQYANENEAWGGTLGGDAVTTTYSVPVTVKDSTGKTVGTGTGKVKVTDTRSTTSGDLSKATGLFGEGNRLASRNFSGIRQAWIVYTFDLGVPAGIKVGHQLLSLSQGQFFDHTKFGDDAIVFFMDPTKNLHVGLLTAKFDEGSTALGTNGDDIDGYVGLAVLKLGAAGNVGANLTYVRASTDASVRLAGTEAPLAGSKFNFYNLGLHGTNTIGPVGLNWEGDYQFGKLGDSTKFKGYGIMADANVKAGPATIVFGGAYGSGSKENSSDVDAFVTSLGGDPHYTFVYEYIVPSAMGITGTGIANTTYLKAGVKYAATKDLSVNGEGYWLQASKTPSGVDKALGFEVDAGLSYKLAENLSYNVKAGYFAPGDFYKTSGVTKGDENAYAVDHWLLLSF